MRTRFPTVAETSRWRATGPPARAAACRVGAPGHGGGGSKGLALGVGALLFFVLASVSSGSVLTREPAAPGYVHEIFGAEDGLPRAGILEALQTRAGYLWLATFDGLVRFDGRRFEVFDGERVPALGSNRIVDLLEARDGTLWILGQQGHLARFSDGVFSACGDARSGSARCDLLEAGPALYSKLLEDRSGTLWVGGHSGLYRVEGAGLRRVESFVGRSLVRKLLEGRDGRLWVGTGSGLWREGSRAFEAVDLGSGSGGSVNSVAEGTDGTVWVALEKEAVGRIRSGRFTRLLEGNASLVAGPGGEIWIGLAGRLLRQSDGELHEVAAAESRASYVLVPGRQVVTTSAGETWVAWADRLLRDGRTVFRLNRPRVSLSSVMVDDSGTVWVTTTRSGDLHAFHPTRLDVVGDGLTSPMVYPVYEDRDGSLWAGDDYLARLAPGDDSFGLVAGPLPGVERIRAILRDRSGELLIGTEQGLYTFRSGVYRGPFGPPALRSTPVYALVEGAGGALWVGTGKGLFRRDSTGRWTRPGSEIDRPAVKVQVIREMADGTLWLGTDGAGLYRFRDGELTAIDRSNGLSSDLVRAIWPAPDGRLWIGTENHGLNRLDPATFGRPGGPEIAVIGRTEGLFSSGVHQIVADGLGNLWMSSNRGIFRARLEELNAVADGDRRHVECIAYAERDGMLNLEANGGVQQAGLRDREGLIWFPTQAGVVRVDPKRALRRVDPPPIHVEHLHVGEKEISIADGGVRLLPVDRTFSVSFSAPFFLSPERLRFRYRLVPFDEDWVEAGSRREAYYTKLPPGDYRFEVAVGLEGSWGEPAVVDVALSPRFYETGWFLALCVLATGAALAGVVRLRDSRQRARRLELERQVAERTATIAEQAEALRRMDELKSRFFANVSHELRTPLTLTLGPLRDALDGAFGPLSGPLTEQIRLAERNGGRLLRLVEQLLDLSRLEAGGLVLRPRRYDLFAHLRDRVEAFQPLAESRGIDLSGRLGSGSVEIVCDPGELEKVFDNLLVNALKHAPSGGSVVVELDGPSGSREVAVRVKDDGPGIAADQIERIFDRFHQADPARGPQSGAGLGLALAREIVELHGGTISVESAEGEGACFEVRLESEPAVLGRPVEQSCDAGEGIGGSPAEALSEALPARPDAAPDGVPGQAETGRRGSRPTVLVVEDHDDVRAYVRRHLEPVYRVIEASDGSAGLELAGRERPDLVVSDVMMPGLDGSELVRRLREDPDLALVPVVLVTAKGAPSDRLQGLHQGADDYLVKPFDPRELRVRVDNLIASRRRLAERIAPPRGLDVSAIDATPADQAFLRRVQAIVEERIDDETLSVEVLAKAAGCDRSYLLRRLRALVDETPSGLIRSLRLQRAAHLLEAGAGAVSEVAYAVGFKSVAHFSNAFLERYGERPSAFAARRRSTASPLSADS